MQPVKAFAFEIKYLSGQELPLDDFVICNTYISSEGVIRTKFERVMRYSDEFDIGANYLLPVSVTYEYKLKNNLAAEIFVDFNLLELKPAQLDRQACDGGSWKMIIYTNGLNIKLKGYMPPEPFGEELADKIMNLIKYKIDPMIF